MTPPTPRERRELIRLLDRLHYILRSRVADGIDNHTSKPFLGMEKCVAADRKDSASAARWVKRLSDGGGL